MEKRGKKTCRFKHVMLYVLDVAYTEDIVSCLVVFDSTHEAIQKIREYRDNT